MAASLPARGEQDPRTGEIEAFVGVSVEPTSNLNDFVRKTDSAFVGTLEKTSVAFVDSAREHLYTVLTFRVVEWLYGNQSAPGVPVVVDVLSPGGMYVEKAGNRTPTRPSKQSQELKVGAEYFVPLESGDKFGAATTGKQMVASPLAMTLLEGTRVSPALKNSAWATKVLTAQASKARETPGPPPPARELFLAAIRTAGAARR
jgi:hypothetical protein